MLKEGDIFSIDIGMEWPLQGLSDEQKNKWRNKFNITNQIKINGKEKKPKCLSGDGKSAHINSLETTARFIYKSQKGKNAKYLAVGIK